MANPEVKAALIACLSGMGYTPDFHVGGLALSGAAVTGMLTLVEPDAAGPTTATVRFYGDADRLDFLDEVSEEVGAHLSGVGDAEPFRLHSIPVQLQVNAGFVDWLCAAIKVEDSDAYTFVDVGCAGEPILSRTL